MRFNQIHQFLDRIDVRAFEHVLFDGAEVALARLAVDWRARGGRFHENVAAFALEPRGIDEIGQLNLAHFLRLNLARQKRPHGAVGGDADLGRIVGDVDRRFEARAVRVAQHEVPLGIFEKVARARVTDATAILLADVHFEKAIAFDEHIQRIARFDGAAGGKTALRVGHARAQAHLDPGRPLIAIGVLDPGLGFLLIHQILEVDALAFEPIGVDVGEIVGNHVNLGLKRGQSRRGGM